MNQWDTIVTLIWIFHIGHEKIALLFAIRLGLASHTLCRENLEMEGSGKRGDQHDSGKRQQDDVRSSNIVAGKG